MNITRNLLHEWYHGGARTPADVQRLAQENLGLTLTAEKVKKILEDQIPLEQDREDGQLDLFQMGMKQPKARHR